MGGKTRPPYAPEFLQQVMESYATGRRIADLAREFGVFEHWISRWIIRARQLVQLPDRGRAVARADNHAPAVAQTQTLSVREPAELERLRKDVRRLPHHRAADFGFRLQPAEGVSSEGGGLFANEGTHGPKGATRS